MAAVTPHTDPAALRERLAAARLYLCTDLARFLDAEGALDEDRVAGPDDDTAHGARRGARAPGPEPRRDDGSSTTGVVPAVMLRRRTCRPAM